MDKKNDFEIITQEFADKYKDKIPPWGFGALGFIVYKRTYSRIKEDGSKENWHETIRRCINGAQKIGAQYTKEEAERLFDLIFNLKCSFGGRMLWQLGTTTVDRFGLASLLNCFAYETEIITSKGIKKIGDLSGQTISVMTELGKWVDAPILNFGKQKLLKLTLSRGVTEKIVYTTENHRWFRKARRHGKERLLNSSRVECQTWELETNDRLVSVYGQSIKNIKPSTFGIAHGIVYGDGAVQYDKTAIRLCGDKNKQLEKYFNNSRTTPLVGGDIIVSNLPIFFKDKPSLDLDKNYLYGWLAGYFTADGNVKESGQIRLHSADINNLLFVKNVCVKLGIGYTSITCQNRLGIDGKYSDLYCLGISGADLTEDFFLIEDHLNNFVNHSYSPRMDWKVKSLEETDRVEDVFCAIVPETHSFALESNILTGNCWYTSMREPEDFCFLFEHLMLGGGVGFSVKREDIHELPRIKKGIKIVHENTNDADFIVPDSRQGWVQLLRNILLAFYNGGKSFTYSTILIRGAGELIRGFGGTASGPGILIEGIEKIVKIFQNREGKKLRSIDVLDINNIIGSVVVAGNVRRSAELAIGDPDDYLYLRAKRWDLGNIPNWRSMSNNSLYIDEYAHISDDVWSGYNGNGEPYGFINLPLSQKYGRLGEEKKDNCEGFNPCAEIGLADGEACNLCEIFLNNINSPEELIECAKLLYKTQKCIWDLPALYEKTSKIVKKNRRIGLGVTGVCQSLDKLDWLDVCYKELRNFDKEWSNFRGWPESIKLTTVKPSGTLSLLAGSSPGGHPAYDYYYNRTVRMSSGDDLVRICRELGYKTEYSLNFDGTENHDTVVVYFPCSVDENALVAKNLGAIQQLELVKKLQTIWSDNSVSVTVYYKKEELNDIKDWLKNNYQDSLKTVSFLLHQEHGFKQAPYQPISREEYEKLIKKIKPIDSLYDIGNGEIESSECSSGACPIK